MDKKLRNASVPATRLHKFCLYEIEKKKQKIF